ncbi:MAG: metal-sensitive transcriptional regulator [Patescibacteria group bacterium]
MADNTQTNQEDFTHQLNRVRGQIDGIAKMVEEKRDCLDVVQQIMAARSGLARAGKTFISKEAVRCSKSAKDKDKLDELLKHLFSLD